MEGDNLDDSEIELNFLVPGDFVVEIDIAQSHAEGKRVRCWAESRPVIEKAGRFKSGGVNINIKSPFTDTPTWYREAWCDLCDEDGNTIWENPDCTKLIALGDAYAELP